MSQTIYPIPDSEKKARLKVFGEQIRLKSDVQINYFLVVFFLAGLLLSLFYDTIEIAAGVGGLCLIAYYSTKLLLPKSDLYQYVLSVVLGIFMAQYIYQMHGMFEMHFIAFIGSAILITYQNWKLQIPLTLVVLIHHAIFGYLQFTGADVYFTELEYMDLQTFIIHAILAAILFFTCGIWAYQFKKYSRRHIELAYNEARLTESELQKDALMKANNELDKFVYSVSHDLRAPLSSMKGVIEISEDITEDELLLEHFSRLKGSINKLDEFIKDILEYSRNSRLKVKHQQIDFKSMLADITDNLRFMSSNNDNQVDITTLIKGDSVFYSDKSRISIILNNLISNAIRYQNPDIKNPFVKVSIEISDAEATIIVEDNGIGISEEHQTKVFEMFYRVSENSVGSGLGLYLVKEIIDKLGGKIKITSGINKGTSFCISIPGNQAEYSDENDTLLNVA